MNFDYPPGATPLHPDEMDGLRLKHVTTREELDRWEQENIQDAMAWLGKRRKSNILTEEFILQLHKKMFGKVWHWAGQFRRTNKNIGVEWTIVPTELRQLLGDAQYWVQHNVFPPDEIAYRLHHKLVWIHLFPNGNGRHSRMMADILLTELYNLEPFTWGSDVLTPAGDTRKHYIDSLKLADNQDYSRLAVFVRS